MGSGVVHNRDGVVAWFQHGRARFAVALVVYLIAAGEGRSALLLRMLEAGIPTLACSFLMMRYFNTDASSRVTLLLLANAAVTVVLELLLAGRLSAALEKRQKLEVGLVFGGVVFRAAYGAAGMQLYGPYTRSEERRVGKERRSRWSPYPQKKRYW